MCTDKNSISTNPCASVFIRGWNSFSELSRFGCGHWPGREIRGSSSWRNTRRKDKTQTFAVRRLEIPELGGFLFCLLFLCVSAALREIALHTLAFVSGHIEFCRHRHAAAAAERSPRQFDAGRHLPAFEFVAVEPIGDPADSLRWKLLAQTRDRRIAFDQAFQNSV